MPKIKISPKLIYSFLSFSTIFFGFGFSIGYCVSKIGKNK